MTPELPAQTPAGGVLLPYQRDLVEAVSKYPVTVYEKSRRIGATWGIGAQGVLLGGAARGDGGMDVLYIGYNLDMAREFIGVCAMWAKSFGRVAGEVGEFLFADQDREGNTRQIAAFRITFASGFEIVALASRPRSLRGRQGFVIIDEAAFHDDLEDLLKAALALLIWGGRVLVISTHDGAENPFAEIVNDCRSGRRPFHLLRTTFDEALHQGLYQRVCLVRGLTWSEAGEHEWALGIRAFYGDGAAEELDVIPAAGSGRFLPLHLIEARASRDVPVLRWRCAPEFVHLPEDLRRLAATGWAEENLGPLLPRLDPLWRSAIGADIARSGDLSVFVPLQIRPDLVRATPFTVELRGVPFAEQRTILFWIMDRLPRLGSGALDATGLGADMAEATASRYGAHRIDQVKLSEPWYREHMPRLKRLFEDAGIIIPADAGTVEDLRSIVVVRGVARIPDKRTQAKGEEADKSGGQRHGDAAVAYALAVYAAARNVGGTEHEAMGRQALAPRFQDFVGVSGADGIAGFFG